MLEINGKGRLDKGEVLRYLGFYGGADNCEQLYEECEQLLLPTLAPKACLETFQINRYGEILDLGFAQTSSKSLYKNLEGCARVAVFAATLGAEVDRLVLKYVKLSPARALVLQAMGSAAIECWCDDVNMEILKRYGVCKPRFSCGYGDLPLELQRDIFAALGVTKRLGITLSDKCFMTPTKSVTAIVGLKK